MPLKMLDFSLHPVHPFLQRFINVYCNDTFSDTKQLDFEIVDLLGRFIFQQNTARDKLLTVNTLTWQSGIYILKISDGTSVFQKKIVKQ